MKNVVLRILIAIGIIVLITLAVAAIFLFEKYFTMVFLIIMGFIGGIAIGWVLYDMAGDILNFFKRR